MRAGVPDPLQGMERRSFAVVPTGEGGGMALAQHRDHCAPDRECVHDPSDGCDPNAGGADCGGICLCVDNILCVQGTVFDASPGVCTCVAKAAG